MRPPRAALRCCPPWWPEGEPWPPNWSDARYWRRRPRPWRPYPWWRFWFIFAPLIAISLVWQVIWALGRAWALNPPGMLSILGPLALGAILFVYGIRRVGRPLGDVVGAADRVAEGDFSVRVHERGSPWLRKLGRAFNSMTERLERQQKQRRDLMADVAHELRTPLAVMQGRLEGMVDGVYPHDAAQVAQILAETRHLSRLVNDLRTLANSEGGTLTLQREPTDLGVLLNDAVSTFRSEADRRHVSLTVNTANDLPIVDVDPPRIREVAANLLANAIRYAPEAGSVTVDARRDAAGIVVSVSDDGPGISAEDLPHVFDRFYKGRSSSGSGLGLAIAHSLVTAHGGTIAARSESGGGTTITFRLPLTPVI